MSQQTSNKTLFLVRHAKSSWENQDLTDFDRPLNNRGKRDAPGMAQFFAASHHDTDLIITSPAIRALTTARIFALALDYPEKQIIINPEIYDASTKQLLNVLKALDDTNSKVACFGHNPSLTELSNYLAQDDIDNVPTCGIVHINLQTANWVNIKAHSADLYAFNYPKKCL